jgi:hypothetical protein
MSHFNLALLVATIAILLPNPCWAQVFVAVEDAYDDRSVIAAIQSDPALIAWQHEVKLFHDRLLKLKERDFLTLLGAPSNHLDSRFAEHEERNTWVTAFLQRFRRADTEFAMLSTEPRMLGLSGLHYADPTLNKDHMDTHRVAGIARFDIFYGLDGTTPAGVRFYLTVDSAFVKLDHVSKLERRLTWEQERFRQIVGAFERRWREVFGWEIDEEREKQQYQGIDSGDVNEKLQALIKWGEEHAWRPQHSPGRWTWYKGSTLVAEAFGGHADPGRAYDFRLYGHDGKRMWERKRAKDEPDTADEPDSDTGSIERGDQADNKGQITMVRWSRPNGPLVRLEHGSLRPSSWRPNRWAWYDVKGKAVRSEWDDNGDGIPDSYQDGDPHERNPGSPLSVEHSWAIHPELIPAAYAIPDQEKRRVHIRKIAAVEDDGSQVRIDPNAREYPVGWIVCGGVAALGVAGCIAFRRKRRKARATA